MSFKRTFKEPKELVEVRYSFNKIVTDRLTDKQRAVFTEVVLNNKTVIEVGEKLGYDSCRKLWYRVRLHFYTLGTEEAQQELKERASREFKRCKQFNPKTYYVQHKPDRVWLTQGTLRNIAKKVLNDE